jgi:hypothetical protein
MSVRKVVAVFRRGEDLRVPVEAIEAVGTDDGTPLVFEPREGELVVRPMTTQEEAEWESASGASREIFYSGEDFIASLRSELGPHDPA